MYRALVADLDGTVVPIASYGDAVDGVTRQAVNDALKAGKTITCATGRSWQEAVSVVKALGIISPCIIEGGTRIIDPQTEETLWQKALPDNVTSNILALFHTEAGYGEIMTSAHPEERLLADVHEVPSKLRFLYLLGIKKDDALRILAKVNEQPDIIAHITPAWSGKDHLDLHVTHQEATKEHAIEVWQKIVGVSVDQTIGMGDSWNDTPIFKRAGLKVAVGNAKPELKELADYIAPSVEHDALQHVITRLLLTRD